MSDPLFSLGARRTAETLTEILIPLTCAGWVWWAARGMLGEPAPTRALSSVEIGLILGGVTAVVTWYAARQVYIIGRRRPWSQLWFSALVVSGSIGGLMWAVPWRFESRCAELGGQVVAVEPLLGAATRSVCQIGAVAGNVYLPGVLLRASWEGEIGLWLGLWLGGVMVVSSLGLRTLRVRPTHMGTYLANELTLRAAMGAQAVAGGDKPADGRVQACGNATLWGEPCAQMYHADRKFEPGEWCVRCAQVYQPADRVLRMRVVSLFTADVDVLNGLERLDALSWAQGESTPPDARISGQERWVKLGYVEVPDVVTVATLLALVHDLLAIWAGEGNETVTLASELAQARASKVAAWIWQGNHDDRLTYARPTPRAHLAVGPTRLRDLPIQTGEELVLQLDIGLLPLELRTGFRQTFLDEGRDPVVQNLKQDLWIPVIGRAAAREGVWVPRIEGDALRTWLALDRIRSDDARGVTSPLPYCMPDAEPSDPNVKPGSIDLVRMPLDRDGEDPIPVRRPGASISEWDWAEWRLIELLRQESLVMVSR